MQLVEPGTLGEEIDQQTGGGRFDAPDEDRHENMSIAVPEILPYPINANKPGTKSDFSRVGTTPHGVEALAEVRIQRQHHRTGSNPGSETLQDIFN